VVAGIHRTVREEVKGMKKAVFLFLVVTLAILWVIIRPGLFVVAPVQGVTQGRTLIYHSRSSGFPFISSTDQLCVRSLGTVDEACRAQAYGVSGPYYDRTIISLPYIEWILERSLP
jgi:hypothetical protein